MYISGLEYFFSRRCVETQACQRFLKLAVLKQFPSPEINFQNRNFKIYENKREDIEFVLHGYPSFPLFLFVFFLIFLLFICFYFFIFILVLNCLLSLIRSDVFVTLISCHLLLFLLVFFVATVFLEIAFSIFKSIWHVFDGWYRNCVEIFQNIFKENWILFFLTKSLIVVILAIVVRSTRDKKSWRRSHLFRDVALLVSIAVWIGRYLKFSKNVILLYPNSKN